MCSEGVSGPGKLWMVVFEVVRTDGVTRFSFEALEDMENLRR